MRISRGLRVVAVAGALAIGVASAAGCGGNEGNAKTANVKPGDMPDGASWTGVYYSQLYGYLHLEQNAGGVTGKWQRPLKDRWGKLNGTAVGDVIHFSYTEYTVGAVGPHSTSTGKGYLKYKRPPGDNVEDTIVGELGEGSDEVGIPFDGVKQRNMMPDLNSIGGTGSTDMGGGDWDSGNGEKGGEPEAPKEPPAPMP